MVCYVLQAIEENVAEQQPVLKVMSERADILKESLQTLLPSKQLDSISTELNPVQESWQLTAHVSRFLLASFCELLFYLNVCVNIFARVIT